MESVPDQPPPDSMCCHVRALYLSIPRHLPPSRSLDHAISLSHLRLVSTVSRTRPTSRSPALLNPPPQSQFPHSPFALPSVNQRLHVLTPSIVPSLLLPSPRAAFFPSFLTGRRGLQALCIVHPPSRPRCHRHRQSARHAVCKMPDDRKPSAQGRTFVRTPIATRTHRTR